MPTYPLTDVARDLWQDRFALTAADLGRPAAVPWSVTKHTLRGGRRDGVDLVRVDNGELALEILPTRGMGLWRARYRGDRLGWDSPVADGPVHPALVNLHDWGGLGWLEGFDELLARCGLESNGPPFEDAGRTYTLHGRLQNLPAHYVALHVDDEPPHAITVEGRVDEAKLFGLRGRLTTRITTVPGSNRVRIRDEVTNLGDAPGRVQLLYHWNFGPPLLEDGARLVAPVEALCPRNARAAEGVDGYDLYGPPEPGFAEQVYLLRLRGAGPEGRTLALLRNRAGDRAVALRFQTAQLPCFTVWKCTRGPREGYVTGLEPATNYPNPRPFEQARGRVATLEPGAAMVAETTLEVLDTAVAVAGAEAEVRALQGGTPPTVHRAPAEPFTDGR